MFSFFVFISAFNASLNPIYGQKCEDTTATNEAIVSNIYAKIKANKNLASQISHINITSKNLAVKIVGWADNKSDYDKIISYAMETDCVRVVNVNDFYESKPSEDQLLSMCQGGTKPCGDICIPKNDVCFITGPEN